jgi:hypothetical protein
VTPFLSLLGIAAATFTKALRDPPDLLGRDQRTNPAEDCKSLAGRWIRADETVDERSAGEMENSPSPLRQVPNSPEVCSVCGNRLKVAASGHLTSPRDPARLETSSAQAEGPPGSAASSGWAGLQGQFTRGEEAALYPLLARLVERVRHCGRPSFRPS